MTRTATPPTVAYTILDYTAQRADFSPDPPPAGMVVTDIGVGVQPPELLWSVEVQVSVRGHGFMRGYGGIFPVRLLRPLRLAPGERPTVEAWVEGAGVERVGVTFVGEVRAR